MRTWLPLLVSVTLFACTHAYKPDRYDLDVARIPQVRSSTPVEVVNAQTRAEQERLFTLGPHKFVGNYKEVSQHLAEQLGQALRDVGVAVGPGAPKRLQVAVMAMSLSQAMFHFRGQVVFHVTTGDGQRFDITTTNGSPGNAYRTMNGTLAIAVLDTLKHPGVQAYLAAPPQPTASGAAQ